jgi:RNA polymerase sigma-70 factor, ECF subfamily
MSGTDGKLRYSSGGQGSGAMHDPSAFVQLYRRNYDAIFRYCVHRLFDRHAAEDLTSEVFLKAARHAGSLGHLDENQFRSWLYRVATNEANTYIRTRIRREKLLRFFGQAPDLEAPQQEDLTEDLARLKKAVMALRPEYQTIITLRFNENFTHEQIAGVLGCKAGTVRSNLSRAITELRARLDSAGESNRREVIR